MRANSGLAGTGAPSNMTNARRGIFLTLANTGKRTHVAVERDLLDDEPSWPLEIFRRWRLHKAAILLSGWSVAFEG